MRVRGMMISQLDTEEGNSEFRSTSCSDNWGGHQGKMFLQEKRRVERERGLGRGSSRREVEWWRQKPMKGKKE